MDEDRLRSGKGLILMSGKKLKESKAAILIFAFLIPFICMMVFWAVCGIYPFGTSSILTGDMDVEFVNFYAYFINTLKTNNDWSYMLTKTLGGDFPGLAAFQLHDPLLFLLLLFPGEKIATGIELIFTLQVSIAGLCASVLLNNRYKRSWMSLLFSTGYAFCAFFFGYLVLTIYFGALMILPLVLYFFLEYLDDRKSFVPFVISACVFIYINYHMGFMLVIFLVLLFAAKIIENTAYVKKFWSVAISGITVVLVDGFFLIRTGLSLLGEKTTTGADYGTYRRFPIDQLFAGMFSGSARNDLRPLIYCSVAVFFCLIMFFLASGIKVREKISGLFIIGAVSVSMWINSIDAVWHGFNNPEGFYWRYAYYISITAVILGYRGFITVTDDEAGKKGTRIIVASAVILYLYMAWLYFRKNPYLDVRTILINAILVAVITVTLLMISKEGKMRTAGFVILLAVSLAETVYSSKTSYMCLNALGEPLPEMSAFWEDYKDIDDVISYVKSTDDGFYRIEKDFDRAINDPSMFDYIGLSHDSSCEKDEILDWLVNFGFCKTVYFTYYNGGSTSFTDDLFGIKYYISRFDSVEKPYDSMSYSGKYFAYENKNALPLAYISPEGFKDADITEGNTFEKQNLLASYWSDRPIFIKAESEVSEEGAKESGAGHYERTDEEGYIVYTIKITENMPLYFYFYAPQRQNGEVFVNGESRDVYFTVNHWNTLCAGTYSPGDTVEIKMQIKDDSLDITEACFYYEDPEALSIWGDSADKLNEGIGPVTKIKSSHLTFTTDSEEESTVIMSIPYEKSWKVMCDGTAIGTGTAIDELMSFEVPAGSHVIDMKYTPEGTYAGIAASVIGLLLFIGRIVINLPNEKCMLREKLFKRSKMQKIAK